jgi:AraC-like DNA-binding protein
MDWVQSLHKAVNYIENNLLNNINNEEIAKRVYSSNENFQKIFKMMAGITIGEYIRNRRLSVAGQDIKRSNEKIINLAFKYGYETPESFTKAFKRFHGVSPLYARNSDINLQIFNPISLQIIIKGGFNMEKVLNWDNCPWRSYDYSDNRILYIDGGTKIHAGKRTHRRKGGEIYGEIILGEDGKIELPNGSIVNAPQNTVVKVKENGECTTIIGNGDAIILKPYGKEITIAQGMIINNEGNIVNQAFSS